MPELGIEPVKELKQKITLKKCVVKLLWIWRKYIIITFSIGLGNAGKDNVFY